MIFSIIIGIPIITPGPVDSVWVEKDPTLQNQIKSFYYMYFVYYNENVVVYCIGGEELRTRTLLFISMRIHGNAIMKLKYYTRQCTYNLGIS